MALKEKIKTTKHAAFSKRNSHLLKAAAYLALGFMMSTGSVLGELHPFGISITAVCKKRYFGYTALGAVFGCLASGIDENTARYISAVTIAAIGALASAAFELGFRPAFPVGVAFSACFITGVALNIKTGVVFSAYVLTLGEAILSGGGAYFFYRALHSDYRRLRFRALPVSDLTCITLSLSILMMNLSALKISFISPAVTVSALLILCGIRFLGERWGIILALSFGFAIGLSNSEAFFTVGALAFSSAVGALFIPLSRAGIGIAFTVSAAFFSIVANNGFSLPFFIGCTVAAAIFILLPHPVISKLDRLSDSGRDASPDAALRQSLVLKLRFASTAMAAISESVEQVREKINDMTRRENELKKNEISESEYIRREIILEKTNQIRRVASDQFSSISGMLEDLAFEFDEAEIFDSSASVKIRRVLGEYEIYPLNISAIEDKFGRMRVEILTDGMSAGLNNPKLTAEIGKACNRYFDKGKITNFKEETMLSFSEKPNYRLSVGFAQHSAEGRLCGDTVKILNDNKGHSILIISDGMGKGSRAALDGAMGAGLLSKLLNAGFGFDSALKVVNSALLVKSNDESLATLDIANIDLFTGKCELFKAGAPASYIIRGENLTRCELSSMPAGILRGIEFARRTAVLRLDDTVVLMSDGITDIGDERLEALLKAASDFEPQYLAEYIVSKALEICDGNKIDDMSIITAKLERNV